MPTTIVLDVSLSMCRPVVSDPTGRYDESTLLVKDLAAIGIERLLEHLSQHCKLEFTALIIFSSLYEIVSTFTRDFDSIKKALATVGEYDKTDLKVGLVGASQHTLEEWGSGTPSQIILITDGQIGTGRTELRKMIASHPQNSQLPLPFPFPSKFSIVCLNKPDDATFKASRSTYQKLLELNGEGNLYVPEGTLNTKSVLTMFDALIKDNFSAYSGKLQCGNLSASITLSPPPQSFYRHFDFDVVREMVGDTLNVCGFLNLGDISSPPAFSRHLVLPLITDKDIAMMSKDSCSDDEGVLEEGKIPSFCVLLHGGLKRESTVALCEIGYNWFGILYSWADNKKKSNLMLSIFEPGVDVIPWLGKICNLGPNNLLSKTMFQNSETPSTFPIKVTEKKSYAQNCVVWIRQGGLQSDVQKILRHARKLPDKQQSFYKELNRVRKAALMYGFPELMSGLASLLERECYSLPSNTHPDASIQLQHASESLRNCEKKDLKQNIIPYKSSYE